MPANTRPILLDVSGQKGIPQHFNKTGDVFEPTEGSEGAIHFKKAGGVVKAVELLPLTAVVTAGADKPVGSAKTLRIEVWGTGNSTFTVEVRAKMNSNTARAIPAWDNINQEFVGQITAAGFYDIDVQGYTNVLAAVIAVGGDVSVAGSFLAE